MTWRKPTLIAMGAVLLYILSSGPVVGTLTWWQEIQGRVRSGTETGHESLALAVFIFYTPLETICERFPLIGKSFGWYVGLWCPADCRENGETDSN